MVNSQRFFMKNLRSKILSGVLSGLLLLPPVLLMTDQASAQTTNDGHGKISVELRSRVRDNPSSNESVRIILQLSDNPSGRLNALLNRNGVHVRAHFRRLSSMVVDLPSGVVD